jgi:hypothetical protein
VATSLEIWSTDRPQWFARDAQIDDTVYRRLDPEYYVWLRSRMVLAKKAAAAGHLDTAAFEESRVRFNAVHGWAIRQFGEEQLLAALQSLATGDYEPPLAEEESKPVPLRRSARSAAEHVPPEAAALVDAISENALALGWNRERLYATGNGHFDPRRGLICYLKPGDRIGEVTLHSIEIIHPLPSEVRHRFYNPDVDQPWIRRVTTEKHGS